MSHAIQNFRDASRQAKHWSLPQKTLRMQRKHGWKQHWRMVQDSSTGLSKRITTKYFLESVSDLLFMQ